MNLYLDTSALVKLYVRERGSIVVRRQVDAASYVATSRVAYPEARSALARRHREGTLSTRGLRGAVKRLDADWPAYVVVELLDQVSYRAGVLAERRSVRGFDAIHLASAVELSALVGGPVLFMAYDLRLADAARLEGLGVAP